MDVIELVCALGLCGKQLSFGQAFFADRARSLLPRGLQSHGDDEEEDEDEQDQEEEEDEDDDEEEPWQVRPLNTRQGPTRTGGTPLCAPSPRAVLQSRISP